MKRPGVSVGRSVCVSGEEEEEEEEVVVVVVVVEKVAPVQTARLQSNRLTSS